MSDGFSLEWVTFYQNLDLSLPKSLKVEVLNPFKNAEVIQLSEWYHEKFYTERKPRIFLFGINPGRHGSGITGIPFTDPIQINEMGFKNEWPQRHELSAEFIQEMIKAYGGIAKFANDFYISSLCPLGFVRNGKNINYYDDPVLMKKTNGFILKSIKKQIALGCRVDKVFCIGQGKNYKYFQVLNKKHKLFDHVSCLPHPRWVMQYRRKSKMEHIAAYLQSLRGVLA